jgi:hypothetical protein
MTGPPRPIGACAISDDRSLPNPRLRIGEITDPEDGSIIAEVITVDGSLVQRLAFNRHPSLFRQID